jgi:hypothetical protein
MQMEPMMPVAFHAPRHPDQRYANFPAAPGFIPPFFDFPPALHPAPVVAPPRMPLPDQPNRNLQEMDEQMRMIVQQMRQEEIDELRARYNVNPAALHALPVTPPPQPNLRLQQVVERQQARVRDLRFRRRHDPAPLPNFPPLPGRPEVRVGGVGDGAQPAGRGVGVDPGVAFGGLDANRAVRNRAVGNREVGNQHRRNGR